MKKFVKKWLLRLLFFLGFCLLIFISPYASTLSFSDKIQTSLGGAIFCFLVPVVGRWIAVKIFHCPEWDKDDNMGE